MLGIFLLAEGDFSNRVEYFCQESLPTQFIFRKPQELYIFFLLQKYTEIARNIWGKVVSGKVKTLENYLRSWLDLLEELPSNFVAQIIFPQKQMLQARTDTA